MTLDLLRSALATAAAVPVTPFGPDGQVDWEAHDRVIRRMVDAGVRLVTPNGNTGEFYSLTAAEARRATESAVVAAGGRADVLAGVGHDLPGAIEAGRHARDHGVRMIMVHQPVGPYISAAGWLEYHRAIAGALPDLGVVLYIRDPRIGARHIRALGDLCPNVIAVKYGIRDPVQFAGVARDAGLDRFTWLAGLAGWCTMIMRTPLSWACRPASIALGRSCPTPASTPAGCPAPLPAAAATADSVARRASAAVSAWNSPVFPFGVTSRTPAPTMRRITRSWASQSTWPSGPNGVTGTAATVASVLRS